MWVRFLRPFTFKPTSTTAVVYQPGVYNVRKVCGEKAVAKGAAEVVKNASGK